MQKLMGKKKEACNTKYTEVFLGTVVHCFLFFLQMRLSMLFLQTCGGASISELLQEKTEKDDEDDEEEDLCNNRGKKKRKLPQIERRGCLSYLFSSNLVALCLSRLRIQISRDTPDNDTAPPAAKPEATAATGGGEAGEKTKEIVSFALLRTQIFFSVLQPCAWQCLFYLGRWVSLQSSCRGRRRSPARARLR